MTDRTIIATILAGAVAAFTYFGWTLTARSAYESAEYTVVEAESPFEIREYPDLMLATTTMKFAAQGNDGSFMRLFRYISGANEREQKIAMTTPVFMEAEAAGGDGQMGFVMPKAFEPGSVPQPSGDGVQIRKRAGGRFAVIRFAGRLNTETVAQAESRLREWLKQKGLAAEGEVEYAGYDPPWTPGPLRRNEVLLRVQ